MSKSKMFYQNPPEGSWVFEDDGEDSEDDVSVDYETAHLDSGSWYSPKISQKRRNLSNRPAKTARSTDSAGPELVMPTLSSPRRRVVPKRRAQEAYESQHRSRAAVNRTKEHPFTWMMVVWDWVLAPVIDYATSVLSLILDYFKPIAAFFILSWLLILLLRRPLTSAISITLQRVCQLPMVSYFEFPFCTITKISGSAEFDQLVTVQSAFEDVLSSSSVGAALPLEMKRGESGIRDLKYVVQYSALPSRNELVFEFTGFIETARQASTDLVRFNSRIGRAVDQVLSTNRWTLQVLDGFKEKELARGALARALQGSVLAHLWPGRLAQDLLLDQYLRHTRAVEETIAELVLEAQALLGILQNLDDRLDVIHGVTTRDGVTLQGNRDELLAQLWTWLGGNRASMKKNKDQLQLLQDVSIYRKNAWDHVSATIVKLQNIAAGLEDLRERVGSSDVVSQSDVPLAVHIQNIELGIERLQEQRTESRGMDEQRYRQVVERQNDHQKKLLDN